MSSPPKITPALLTRVQAFEALRRNLELTGLQEKTVATRHHKVRDAIASQLTVVDHFLTGSYRRQTLIGPLKQADVDVVVVLDRSYRSRGPRAVLDLVRVALLVEYTKTPKISRNGQAVTITFSDFVLDVVPAFAHPWWAWDNGWDICDSGSERWISTNPKKHVEIGAGANRLHNGQLVPRIKQLKAWNRTVGEPLHSFHLEALAWSIFGPYYGPSWFWSSFTVNADWTSARYFFDKARQSLSGALSDPAGTGKDVALYLHGTELKSATSKVTTAYERCLRAEKAAKTGDLAVMHETYRRVFGDYYP
ncbi:MAG: hypothetical protein WBZ07_01975, partial [Candidatus Dormiibacterota bacterium]